MTSLREEDRKLYSKIFGKKFERTTLLSEELQRQENRDDQEYKEDQPSIFLSRDEYQSGDEYSDNDDFVDLLDEDFFKRKKQIKFKGERILSETNENMYRHRLIPFPSTILKNHKEVDPVIMFYLLCLYEGAFRIVYVDKNIDADIPIFIKNQFDVDVNEHGSEYRSKHGRYYSNRTDYISNGLMEESMMWREGKEQVEQYAEYTEECYLIIKYKDEDDLQFRKVLPYYSGSEINAINSLISKYNIFDTILHFPWIYRNPNKTERRRCVMSNVNIILLGYKIFCYTMGINMDTDDSLTIQNIFDIVTRQKAASIPRKDIGQQTISVSKNIVDIFRYFSYSKVINILPRFVESKTKEYKEDPFDIPGELSIIYYTRHTPSRDTYHATFLISDKKTRNVLLYDPHGFTSTKNINSDTMKLIFKDQIDIESIAKNLVLGIQHYDKEGYCVYFSCMFMIIFMLVYSWTRIDPIILLNCIESVIHDASNTIELIKYFAFQIQLKMVQKQNKLYTPSNDNYTVFNEKENKNSSYLLSWFIVNLSTIIDKFDTNEYTPYINNLLKTDSDITIGNVSTRSVLQYIKRKDIRSIISCIDTIQNSSDAKSYGYAYTYCIILQLHKLCFKLGQKLAIEYNSDRIFSGIKTQFYFWVQTTKTSNPLCIKYVDPEFIVPNEEL